MWNYNTTSVDIFLKRSNLMGARNLLQAANVPFDVVIDDMQKAIDQENPPKDQLELWENRDGKLPVPEDGAIETASRLSDAAREVPRDLFMIPTISRLSRGSVILKDSPRPLRLLRLLASPCVISAYIIDRGLFLGGENV